MRGKKKGNSMKTPFVAVGGSGGFSSGVMEPGPLAERATPAKPELVDQYMTTLTTLAFEREQLTAEDSAEIDDLVGQRIGVNQHIKELIERVHTRVQRKLAAALEQAKGAVRVQQGIVEAHRSKITVMGQELNELRKKESACIGRFHEAQQRRRELSRYAAAKTVSQAERELADASAAASAAANDAGMLLAQINNAKMVEGEPLMLKLNALIADEARLSWSVHGTSYTDEYGLVHPPRNVA
jgi:hypothetical protein